MPKISIILTSFNHGKYLREAIDSVLAQTFSDWELIIWDDASTDDSWEIIQSYRDERIQAHKNERSLGPVHGVNKAISEIAQGEYIAIHHSDDVWTSQKLAAQVAILDKNPKISAVFTWAQIIDDNGEEASLDWFSSASLSRWEWLRQLFVGENHLNHPSLLIRKSCYEAVGLYKPGLGQTADAEMWARLLLQFDIFVIPEKLTKHRFHSDGSNTSGAGLTKSIRTENEWNLIRINYFSLTEEEKIYHIFPNLVRLYNPSGCVPVFLWAMACLQECSSRAAWTLGLKTLYELIADDATSRKIKELYNFDDLKLIEISGKFDPFAFEISERQNQAFINAQNELNQRNNEVESLNGQVESLNGQVESLNGQVESLNGQVESLNGQVESLNGQVESLNSQNAHLSDHVSHLESDRADLNQNILEKDASISHLNHRLTEREEEVSVLNQTLIEKDAVINHLHQLVVERDMQLASILNSKAWRLTQPLRWTSSSARKALQLAKSVTVQEVARYTFRALPLSKATKVSLKYAAFENLGFMFRGQDYYRAWKSTKDLQGSSPLKISGVSTAQPMDIDFPADAEKILVIDATTPTPDRDSGSLDTWFYLKVMLELGFDVTFIPHDLKPLGIYTENLRALGVRVLTCNEIASIENFLEQHGQSIDIAFLYRVHVARLQLPLIKKYSPNARIIFDTVDLHYLREERQAQLSGDTDSIRSAQYTKQAEYDMMHAADVTIVLSQTEREIIAAEDPTLKPLVIPYIREIKGCQNSFINRSNIVFIGGFLHQPNVDAIHYFVSDIWPIVRSKLAGVNLLVIGSHPTEEITLLAKQDDRIQVIGFVEDLDPYFSQCRLSIAPLRYGAGIKGKIGTSATYGVPCVATSLAIEGMGLVDGAEVLVGNTPEQFAEKVVSLYTDEQLWTTLSQRLLAFAQRNYSYEIGKARIERLLQSVSKRQGKQMLEFTNVETLSEYINYRQCRSNEYARRAALEKSFIGNPQGFALEGYCAVCTRPTSFHVDFQYAFSDAEGNPYPNWRERLVCCHCELNNRVRASIHLFQQECKPRKDASIYITEQTTPLFSWMKRNYATVTGSEFLGEDLKPGSTNWSGLRHESLTNLSFPDSSFDFILSFDVLEHIPNYKAAISECFRVLRPGGQIIFSVPFSLESDNHIVRAKVRDDGSVEHLMEPEYHGDPVNSDGCLCFYHFGWQLIQEFQEAGFLTAKAYFYWSSELGYLGVDQLLFIASK